jgi:glycosyltransferase involved in cell wall biosynthesis
MLLTAMIPAHNAADTLEAALVSVLNQAFQDFELWILENGSTDATLEIARRYESDRVKVFELGPIGFQNALEWGIKNAQTPYIARMDADDVCLPQRFSQQITVLEENPDYVLCGSDVMVLTPFNHIIQVCYRGRVSGEVGFMHMSDIYGVEKRFFGDPTVVFRREAALNVGLYDSRFPVGDVSLWIRMLKDAKGYQLAEPALLYRWVPKSMSNTLKFNQQTLACRLEYYGNVYPNAEAVLQLPPEEMPEVGPVSFWTRVALLEMLTGNKEAYFEALRLAGLPVGWVAKVKIRFFQAYRVYHWWRYGVSYFPRKDLEAQNVTK